MSDERADVPRGLSRRQETLKRAFDLAIAVPGFALTFPVIVGAVLAATIDTREWGVFSQVRVGRYGQVFKVHKVRSMKSSSTYSSTVTTSSDVRITRLGAVLRRFKIDELPQLWNVIRGEMSLVGPRPDVPGWADALEGEERIILSIRPGITGPATLAYRNEEDLLSTVDDAEAYNRDVLWPSKCKMNATYVKSWNLGEDIALLVGTVTGRASSVES